MMRGPVVAGPRPSQGDAAQIKNADIKNVSRLGGIARAAGFQVGSTAVDSSKSGPSRDVDRSAESIDSSRSQDRDRAARFDRGRVKTPDLVFSPGHNRAKHRNLYVFCARHQMGGHDDRGRRKALQRIMMLSYAHPIEPQRLYVSDTLDHTAVGLEAARRLHGKFANLREVR